MIYVGIWVVCGLCAGTIYQQKGRSFGVGFLAGVILGPLGLLLALCSSKKEE